MRESVEIGRVSAAPTGAGRSAVARGPWARGAAGPGAAAGSSRAGGRRSTTCHERRPRVSPARRGGRPGRPSPADRRRAPPRRSPRARGAGSRESSSSAGGGRSAARLAPPRGLAAGERGGGRVDVGDRHRPRLAKAQDTSNDPAEHPAAQVGVPQHRHLRSGRGRSASTVVTGRPASIRRRPARLRAGGRRSLPLPGAIARATPGSPYALADSSLIRAFSREISLDPPPPVGVLERQDRS